LFKKEVSEMAATTLHGKMTRDTLQSLGWDIRQINKIARYINGVDIVFGHGHGSCHRVGKYQREFEKYGGKVCNFPAAERNAAEFLKKAEEACLAGDKGRVIKHLGYSIHFIQDALCPEHIFPFQENIILGPFEPHMNFMFYAAWVYFRRDWPELMRNARPTEILNPDDLCRKLEESADWIRSFPCSFKREDGKRIIDPEGGDISFFKSWRMSDKNIGRWLERTASLTKGTIQFLLNKSSG
jgi:hypothetical protein